MRQQIIAIVAFLSFISLPIIINGQDGDTTWPSLASAGKDTPEAPRFIIESKKLEIARNVSNPLSVTRCFPSSQPCRMQVNDFYSEWNGFDGILRPDVMMHHYRRVKFDRHFTSSGTYVYFLPKHEVFYLWGNCGMDHADELAGPFAGDPRLVLKKLADDPDAVAEFGIGDLIVPFRAEGDKAWPAIADIDVSKLEVATGVSNPLSLDRCVASEECVLKLEDFSTIQNFRRVLRPGILAHYYPGEAHQYVFYLPKQNIFYVAEYGSAVITVSGPFAGDPRVVLKR